MGRVNLSAGSNDEVVKCKSNAYTYGCKEECDLGITVVFQLFKNV